MENFNEIRNKFETAFKAIEGEKTECNLDPEYENIGAIAKKTSEYLPMSQHPSTQKLFKPPRPRPRQPQILSNNEYENISYANQKPIENTNRLTRSVRKKKTKKPRTKPLDILPSIDENFARLNLSFSEAEYANTVPKKLTTEHVISDNLIPQTNLDGKQGYSDDFSQTSNEYIDNPLYVDFFQRMGLSPIENYSETKPLVISNFPNEDQIFPTQKKLSAPIVPTLSNPKKTKNKIKNLTKEPSAPSSFKEDDEPIFANITQVNPDGTIEWESWQGPSAPSKKIQASESKVSKFLPKNLNFWSKSSKNKQETSEETSVVEAKKSFTTL